MVDELDPLSPLARRAFDAERGRPDADEAMRDRVLSRVVGTIAVGTAAAAAGAAATAGTASAATTGAGSAAGAAGAAAGTAGTGAVAVGITVKTIPWLVVAFAAGGGTGAAIHARVATPPPQIEVSAPQQTARAPLPGPVRDTPAASAAPSASTSASSPEPPRAPAPAPPRSAAPAGGSDVDLGAERALVDRARMAIARGQSGAALDAVDAHARSYPRGRLAEEREALAVQALVQAGRTTEARARADRFRATYPQSVFSSVIDSAVPPR